MQTLEQLSAAATELLPCPFCGGVAELDHYQPFRAYRTGEPLDQPAVYCTECSAQIAHYPKDIGLDRTDTAELVMAAWNTRTGQLVAVTDNATDIAFEIGRQAHEKTGVTPALREVMAIHKANKDGLADDAVERLLWHVEQCLGPISRETCEVVGDDDYSILRHNFKCVLAAKGTGDE